MSRDVAFSMKPHMRKGSIIWICPGNMAPNYTGLVGDVLITAAVTGAMQAEGWRVHFITNHLMSARVRSTWGVSTTELAVIDQHMVLDNADVVRARDADHVFIVRAHGDKEGNSWQKQLVDAGVDPRRLCRIGSLDAYAAGGPHIVEQIVAQMADHVRLDRAGPFLPLLSLAEADLDGLSNLEKTAGTLIIPFAGARQKWLPTDTVLELARALTDFGPVCVAGSKADSEMRGLQEIESALKSCSIPADCLSESFEGIARVAARCSRVLCVDGGLCWAAVSGLNWLVREGRLRGDDFPEITVVLGRDLWWNRAPTAPVWRPLACCPDRVHQLNAAQRLRLADISADWLLKMSRPCLPAAVVGSDSHLKTSPSR